LLKRDGNGTLDVLLTVPFPCTFYDVSDLVSQDCVINIEMFVPDYESCKSTVTGLGFCGTEIHRNNWNQIHSLKIQHRSAQIYNINKENKIFLHTSKIAGTELWNNVILPEINVSSSISLTNGFLNFMEDLVRIFC
jgi:hypothetical protein